MGVERTIPVVLLVCNQPKGDEPCADHRLGVPVHRVISTFLIKRSGRTVKSGAQSGAVTLIQRLCHIPIGFWPECRKESADTAGFTNQRQ